ncbi:MAG: cation:proton antiporter [Candidatus Eremiobacteraeota bacterium]|nr:cation:proton antiporter [Candidatus Eremiobacteraeota bacterium]
MKLWQIAALLVAGIVVGTLEPGKLSWLFGHVTLYVFLPALIFEASWQLDLRLMRAAWKAIAALAFPGVAITAAIVSAAVHYLAGVPVAVALLLGAVLSATDPVAVVAIFRRLSVPPLLATIVESESLLNDAVAVVLYRGVLLQIAIGLSVGSGLRIAAAAVVGVLLGIAIGVAIAYLTAFALRGSVGTAVQTVATFAAAYLAYFAADRLGLSGIFAVVALGIALRELERRNLRVESAAGVERAWDRAAIAANVVLFFLLGAALDVTHLRSDLRLIGVTLLAVFVARFVLAYGLLAIARPQVDSRWKVVVRLAGVRGALSLALALATPAFLSGRDVVIDATFAVVLVTVLVSSLTLEPRVANLKLLDP